MKNVLAEWSQGGGGQGRYCPGAPSDHTQSPRPAGVGYICGLWVLPDQYNSQSKHTNADCAQFIFPLYSFIFCHL